MIRTRNVWLCVCAAVAGIAAQARPALSQSASRSAEPSGLAGAHQAPTKGYADDVLEWIGKKAGVLIFCDAATSRERVPLPTAEAAISADNVEQFIERVVKAMPGASFGKLYLPPPPKGRTWKGEQVLALALAQAQLYGPVGAIAPKGEVEIFSQKLPEAKAKDVIDALGLKPVYVVTSSHRGGSYTGVWDTTFGEMRLRQSGNRVTGTYTSNDGLIEGVVQNGVLRFKWLERATQGAGAGRFALAADGDSFNGTWGYDMNPDAGTSSWTGTRLSRDPRAPGRSSTPR